MRRLGALRVAALSALMSGAFAACGGSSSTTPRTLHVPGDAATIQGAVDRARSGDLVLIAAGEYHESVTVTTPRIVIRGVDRNAVVLDGRFAFENGFTVKADGVAVENLTVRNFNANGVLFSGLIQQSSGTGQPLVGYRASYVTTYDNGLYGLYAFAAQDGVFEHSYASGHPDSGFYIGQCKPCNAVVRDVVGEHNAIGYEGTNSSTNVFIVSSTFAHNRVGITTGSQDLELLAPQGGATIAANRVLDNDDPNAPATGQGAFGYGIAITGGTNDVVTKNLVTGHDSGGILITDLGRFPPQGNRVEGNMLTGNRVDLAFVVVGNPGPASGNCFAGNTYSTSTPESIEARIPCTGVGSGGPSLSVPSLGAPGGADFRTLPAPPSQPNMPNATTAPAQPAVDIDWHVDVNALSVPSA
jgi:Right handed beta helix region